jgi:aldehyde dehydrogenase (NAD+)
MAEDYKNLIGGKWCDSESKRTFENRNPANWDEMVGVFPKSTAKDMEKAVASAKKALKTWKNVPVPKRGEILGRCGDIMVERKEELAKLETREMGKVIKETRGDVQEGIDTAYYAFGEGRRFFGITTPSELTEKICYTVRKPIGIAGLITPWNFPMAIPCWKVIPALLSGNTAVIKPASDTPATATKLVEILMEAGIPEGVINIVHGAGREVGEALLAHPDVGVISFTGSSEVGSRIAEVSGKTLKRVSLELGGKNAQIVMSDADLELAIDGVLWGAFGTTGQRCTATSRLILDGKIYDTFIEMLAERAKKIKIGNGLDELIEMGPVINSGQREIIHNYVQIGKKEGAKLVVGGEFYEEGECSKGWFYKPTIFADVKAGMRIEQEEIFGPVLSVIKFNTFEEAITIMNDTIYGLSSSIYTKDVNIAMKAAEEIEAGITYINGPTIGAECHLPFGGVKNTGNGHREGGLAVYEIFTETKTIYVDYSGKLQKAQIDTTVEK